MIFRTSKSCATSSYAHVKIKSGKEKNGCIGSQFLRNCFSKLSDYL